MNVYLLSMTTMKVIMFSMISIESDKSNDFGIFEAMSH